MAARAVKGSLRRFAPLTASRGAMVDGDTTDGSDGKGNLPAPLHLEYESRVAFFCLSFFGGKSIIQHIR